MEDTTGGAEKRDGGGKGAGYQRREIRNRPFEFVHVFSVSSLIASLVAKLVQLCVVRGSRTQSVSLLAKSFNLAEVDN